MCLIETMRILFYHTCGEMLIFDGQVPTVLMQSNQVDRPLLLPANPGQLGCLFFYEICRPNTAACQGFPLYDLDYNETYGLIHIHLTFIWVFCHSIFGRVHIQMYIVDVARLSATRCVRDDLEVRN